MGNNYYSTVENFIQGMRVVLVFRGKLAAAVILLSPRTPDLVVFFFFFFFVFFLKSEIILPSWY